MFTPSSSKYTWTSFGYCWLFSANFFILMTLVKLLSKQAKSEFFWVKYVLCICMRKKDGHLHQQYTYLVLHLDMPILGSST